jgi:hypothetical protein
MVGEFTPVILAAQRRGQESYKLKFSLGNLARLKKEGRKEGRKKFSSILVEVKLCISFDSEIPFLVIFSRLERSPHTYVYKIIYMYDQAGGIAQGWIV